MSQPENLLDFWIEAQRLAGDYADKSSHFKMHNFEVTLYAKLCETLEIYYDTCAKQLDIERQALIDRIDQERQRKDEEQKPDGDSSECTN